MSEQKPRPSGTPKIFIQGKLPTDVSRKIITGGELVQRPPKPPPQPTKPTPPPPKKSK
ncbi:MAG TPA: hypothetical protein VN836_11360 [Verrucomicrobiae bacterium]|nr:hypothetical protein [Verrucomicrobiae bacterium]